MNNCINNFNQVYINLISEAATEKSILKKTVKIIEIIPDMVDGDESVKNNLEELKKKIKSYSNSSLDNFLKNIGKQFSKLDLKIDQKSGQKYDDKSKNDKSNDSDDELGE